MTSDEADRYGSLNIAETDSSRSAGVKYRTLQHSILNSRHMTEKVGLDHEVNVDSSWLK